eukprot:scaffold138263_cov19-Tisochrysis_lutea.AAC.1
MAQDSLNVHITFAGPSFGRRFLVRALETLRLIWGANSIPCSSFACLTVVVLLYVILLFVLATIFGAILTVERD